MKTRYLLIILYVLMALAGCALFKKTSKATSKGSQKSIKQSELRKLDLKTANKETNVFTYRDDGSIYQYQNIKENIDEASLGKLKVAEKQTAKQEQKVKQGEPVKTWIYVGIVMVLIGCFLAYKKIFLPYTNKLRKV